MDRKAEWGVPLADVRVPSWYGTYAYAVMASALIGTLRKRRAWDDATATMTEVGTLLAERMVEGDKRDERVAELTESIAALTERMESYGRRSVKLAAASLAVAVVALVVAVAVALAA